MDDDSNAKKEDELTGEVLLPENDDEMPIEDDFDDDFLGGKSKKKLSDDGHESLDDMADEELDDFGDEDSFDDNSDW